MLSRRFKPTEYAPAARMAGPLAPPLEDGVAEAHGGQAEDLRRLLGHEVVGPRWPRVVLAEQADLPTCNISISIRVCSATRPPSIE